MAEEKAIEREIYAIPDDDIDVRLIQRQIANAINASKGKKTSDAKTPPPLDPIDKSGAKSSGTSQEQDQTTEQASSSDDGVKVAKSSSLNSSEDSMDINELVNESEAEVSLDLLEQLTNKITSEMGGGLSQPSELNETNIETQINNIEHQEEMSVVEAINKDNEKTIVTEQISEYPINQMDSEYIQSLNYLEGDKKYKKYVIYIDEVNNDFIESLSIKERKDLINSILREQDDIRIIKREEQRIRRLVTWILILVLSVLFLVPIIYTSINFCIESSIENLHRQQANFDVLFKDFNKIKKK